MDLLRRRMMMAKAASDPYKDMVTLEFTCSSSAAKTVVDKAAKLAKLVIDGTEVAVVSDGQTYTFEAGSHKVGWLGLDKATIENNQMPQLASSSDTAKYITVPDCVTYIGAYGMRGFPCSSPNRFVCHAVTPPTCASTTSIGLLYFNYSVRPAYVPDGSVDAYKEAFGWSQYSTAYHPMSDLP